MKGLQLLDTEEMWNHCLWTSITHGELSTDPITLASHTSSSKDISR